MVAPYQHRHRRPPAALSRTVVTRCRTRSRSRYPRADVLIAGLQFAANAGMTRLMSLFSGWILGAVLVLSTFGHAAAQSQFPYGVLIADIGSAPQAADAGFRVMASTVSWRRTEP